MKKSSELGLRPKREADLRIAVITTFLSLIPTSYAALGSNSIILYTDLLRCLVEFLAILLSWLVLRRIAIGGKARFDYGHGKLEQMSSAVVALAMLSTFIIVVVSAVQRALNPEPVNNVVFGLIFGILSVAGNSYLWIRYWKVSKQSDSPIFEAQARLFRAKTFATVVVVLALLPSLTEYSSGLSLYADPLGALLLSGFLLFSAVGLLSSSTHELLDCSIEESLQLSILGMLVKFDSEYTGLQSIRSRRAGGKIVIELALTFDGECTLTEVRARSTRMTEYLSALIPGSEIIIIPYA